LSEEVEMIHILVMLLVLCIVLGIVLYIFNNVPLLAPFAWVANLVCVVIILIFLIQVLLGLDPGCGVGLWPGIGRLR
jgi:uncharacterized MAPEG superfamily protein